MTAATMDRLLADPDRQTEARSKLRDLLDSEPTTLAYLKWSKMLPAADAPRDVAIISSFTIETITPYFAVEAYLAGCPTTPRFVQYGLWENALHDPGFFQFGSPHACVLLLHEDALGRAGATGAADARTQFITAVDAFRAHSKTPLFIATMCRPESVNALWQGMGTRRCGNAIDEISGALSTLAERHDDIYGLDLAGWLAASGGDWFDGTGALSNLSIVSRKAMPALARGIARAVTCLSQPRRKVLALDLDNTLWGGTVGEDGVDRLKLGQDWPGPAFVSFQNFLSGLRQTGVLLAVNSKNNEADAREVFDTRPEMSLDWDDFSARRVNWQNKADNIIEIANELGLGLNSIVFADDSPVECALVRELLPEVEVVELGTDPSQFADKILRTGAFDTLSVSQEDKNRADNYLAENKRQEILEKAGGLSDFFASLDLHLSIQSVNSRNAERVHQLINKTNQFNISLERLDLERVRESGNGFEEIFCAGLTDKFSDYGIIGTIHLNLSGEALQIRNITISCRALGRQVEEALIAFCCDRAKRANIKSLEACFVEGPRNAQVGDFLRTLHFNLQSSKERKKLFVLELEHNAVQWPEHIDVDLSC